MELLSFKAKQQTHDQYKKHQRQIQIIVTETRLRHLSVWSRSHDSGSHQQSEELDSRFDSQREVLTHGYGGFEVFLALLTDQFSSQMRSSETTGNTSHCVRSGSKPDISPSPFMETCAPPPCLLKLFVEFFTHLPLSALIYSSQQMVLGDGGVRDGLLTDCSAEGERMKTELKVRSWSKSLQIKHQTPGGDKHLFKSKQDKTVGQCLIIILTNLWWL